MRFRASLWVFLVGSVLASPAWAPPTEVQEQARARWNQLSRDQKAATIQWVLGSGAILRFIEKNQDDLREFLRTGVEDESFRILESATRESLARYEAEFAKNHPDKTGDRLRMRMELEERYWTLRTNARLVDIVKNLRAAAFTLDGSEVTVYRRNSAQNVTGNETTILATFQATTTELSYARQHGDSEERGDLVRIVLEKPIVIVPPAFAARGIEPFGVEPGTLEFYPKYRESRPELPKLAPFGRLGLPNVQLNYWQLYRGDFLLAFFEATYPAEAAKPKFLATRSESEIVLAPGNVLAANGTRGRGPNALRSYRCHRDFSLLSGD